MISPGYDRHTPSFMVSPWNRVFRMLGYEELDLVEYPDGEKAIITYLNKPIIPSLTRWNFVLQNVRNVEVTPSWCKHWADRLNLEKRHVWDDLAKGDREHLRLAKEQDRRSEDFAERMLDGVKRNPDLMERIAKNGLRELDPRRMLNHISRNKLGRHARDLKER